MIYRIDGGAWHEFTGHTFTIADGTDLDLAYADQQRRDDDDGSNRPSTVNSGHYLRTSPRTSNTRPNRSNPHHRSAPGLRSRGRWSFGIRNQM